MKPILRVLVVEDDEVDYGRVERALSQASAAENSFEVIHRPSLATAIDFLASQTVDLILLDLYLSDSRGIQTVTNLADAAADTPVIALTGLEDERMISEVVQAGAMDYMSKAQVEPESLSCLIVDVIKRSSGAGCNRG